MKKKPKNDSADTQRTNSVLNICFDPDRFAPSIRHPRAVFCVLVRPHETLRSISSHHYHAEEMIIRKLTTRYHRLGPKKFQRKYRGSEFRLYRFLKDGTPVISRPCRTCCHRFRKLSRLTGLSWPVVWSDRDGSGADLSHRISNRYISRGMQRDLGYNDQLIARAII